MKQISLQKLRLLFTGLFFWVMPGTAQHAATALQKADRLYRQADSLFNLQQDSLALLKYQQVKQMYLANRSVNPNLADACLGMGIIYQTDERYGQAIKAYKESVYYFRRLRPRVDSLAIYPLILIAGSYTSLEKYDSAYVYYEQVAPLLARYPGSPHALRFYNSMGFLNYSYGNYAQSINYFEKALKALAYDQEKAGPASQQKLVRYVIYHNNIAGALHKLGRYREAIDKTRELIRYGFIPNVLYQHMASAFLQIKQPDSARAYLNKIDIRAINQNLIPGSQGINPIKAEIEYYTSLGLLALLEKQSARALAYFNRARQISVKKFSLDGDRDGLASAYAGIGQAYALQQRYGAALKSYRQAIETLHFNARIPDKYRSAYDLHNIASPLLLFEVLAQKAQLQQQYYGTSRKIKDLGAALHTYQAAFRLADLIRKGYDSDKAKLFFIHTVSPLYEDAIATAFRLFGQTLRHSYLEEAFVLAEQSKAAVLAESLRELEIRQVPGISARLLQQERDLKLNLAALNSSLAEAGDPARKESYRDQLRETEIKLARTLKELEKNKQYYQLKYDTSPMQVRQIQQALDQQTALLAYFVGRKHLYGFVITRKGFTARQLGSTATFNRNWQALYQALYQAQPGFRYRGDLPASRLYRQLLAPLAAAIAGKERLVIIQDKDLCYLPFEALVSDLPTTRYLLQDYTVRYAYSGKLLSQQADKSRRKRRASIMAMAPFALAADWQTGDRAGQLVPLFASAQEVKQIGGQIYLGPAATKQRLVKEAEAYDILHLATHAKANSQEPLHSFIAFYPQADQGGYRLYVPEIYNLRLDKLKLVVLSACETGGGKLVNGEGIMSLARAFAYAGCPSTVTTLWKAEDKTTAYISTRLYAYLKAGKPKDVALRLAKLDYLENQSNWRQRSPVYWANFIFIGDQTPVYRNFAVLWWMAGLFVAALAAWYCYRRGRLAGARLKKKKEYAAGQPLL